MTGIGRGLFVRALSGVNLRNADSSRMGAKQSKVRVGRACWVFPAGIDNRVFRFVLEDDKVSREQLFYVLSSRQPCWFRF